MRLVIVGGSDAGISAALRARELDASADITVMLADAFPNYSICGLPFYLSGETPNWHQLVHRTESEGIELLTNHTAQAFDPSRKQVSAIDEAEREKTIAYDRLLIEPARGRSFRLFPEWISRARTRCTQWTTAFASTGIWRIGSRARPPSWARVISDWRWPTLSRIAD
jgi:hypothetical protein